MPLKRLGAPPAVAPVAAPSNVTTLKPKIAKPAAVSVTPIAEAKVETLIAVETVLNVRRMYPGGEDTTETLDVRLFATKPGSISVAAEQRLGSIAQGGKVSVMLTVPYYLEELEGAQTFASEKVHEFLAKEQDYLVELAGEGAGSQEVVVGDDGIPVEGAEETGEGEGEAEGEAEEVTEDYVRGLESMDDLVTLCGEIGVDFDPAEFADDLDAAKEAVIAAAFAEGAEGEEVVTEGEESGEEEAETYTEEELLAMSLENMAELFKLWDINNGKLPARAKGATDASHIKRLTAIVLKYQEEALAEQQAAE